MTLPPSERGPVINQSSSSTAYTHFVAFPLHCNYEKKLMPAHEQLRENLQLLGEKLNENVTDNQQKWKMKSFNGLHITLYLLTLKDEVDKEKAIEVLKELDFQGLRGSTNNETVKKEEDEDDDKVMEELGGGSVVKETDQSMSLPPLPILLSNLETFHPPTSSKSKITLHTIPTVDRTKSNSTVDKITYLHSVIHAAFDRHFPDRETRPWVPHVTVATQVPSRRRDKSSRSKQSHGGGASVTDAQGNYVDERMVAVNSYNQQAQEETDADRGSGVLVSGLEIDRVGLYKMGASEEKEVLDENGCVVLEGGDYHCLAEARIL